MAKTVVKRRSRDPDATRDKLLHAAFEEIYRRGFQAASLDTILTKAGVTKGALYHHFPDKAALGYAVVDEVVTGLLLKRWGVLEPASGDPLGALQQVLREDRPVSPPARSSSDVRSTTWRRRCLRWTSDFASE